MMQRRCNQRDIQDSNQTKNYDVSITLIRATQYRPIRRANFSWFESSHDRIVINQYYSYYVTITSWHRHSYTHSYSDVIDSYLTFLKSYSVNYFETAHGSYEANHGTSITNDRNKNHHYHVHRRVNVTSSHNNSHVKEDKSSVEDNGCNITLYSNSASFVSVLTDVFIFREQ